MAANPYEALVEKNPYEELTEQAAQKKRRSIPGDMGSLLSAGEAYGALQKLLEDVAYAAGGKVTDATRSPEAGFVANVATQAVPSVLTGGLVKNALVDPMKDAGRWLMTKAVKPVQKHRDSGKAEQAIETMLERGISQSKGAFEKVEGRVSGLNKEIDQILSASPGRVSTTAVANRLYDAVQKAERQALGTEEADAIRKYWQQFVAQHPQNISVMMANELKKGTYKSLGDRPYLATAGSPDLAAKAKTEKTLARGFKEEIASAEPRVVGPMKEQSDLINVLKVAGGRGEANKNVFGLPLLAPTQSQLLAMLADRSNWAMSLGARGLYSGADSIPFGVGALAGAGLMAETGQPPESERGALYRYLRGALPPY